MSYKLHLDLFEGPLDLLLYLIKKDDIDITDIPIVDITDQYMEYIELMETVDLEIVGDFLVMAATLIQIKSKMLLPPDPTDEDEEEIDPRAELAERLREYQKFKEAAGDLQERREERQNLLARALDEEAKRQLQIDSREVYVDTSLFDLINALADALRKTPEEILHEVTTEEFTIEQKIHDILHILTDKSSVNLSEIFSKSRSKKEIVTTFMAALELIRLKEVILFQKRNFSEIQITRNQEKIEAPVI